MSELLELARNIRENPSQLHCDCQHKDAPQTPDFDWNVFVKRIDTMIAKRKVEPFRKIKLALNSLNADLTYENRSRAKVLLHDVLELWECKARESNELIPRAI